MSRTMTTSELFDQLENAKTDRGVCARMIANAVVASAKPAPITTRDYVEAVERVKQLRAAIEAGR